MHKSVLFEHNRCGGLVRRGCVPAAYCVPDLLLLRPLRFFARDKAEAAGGMNRNVA